MVSEGDTNAGQALRFALRVHSTVAGAPVRWECDLSQMSPAAVDGWIDPDSWSVEHEGQALPFRLDADTLDGRRHTVRFRAPVAGEADVMVTAVLHVAPRPAPSPPLSRTIPLIGAGEALSLGATDAVGDLHVGLQTVVDVVDWYGRGQADLLLCCLGHEGGAFIYASTENEAAGSESANARSVFRRAGRIPGFGGDPQGYNGKVRAVDFRGDGRFDLLECRGSRILWHQNVGDIGAPRFAPPEPLEVGGEPFDLGARSQTLCPVDLGNGRVSLIVGTNDWKDYWPKDVGAWEDRPGYRPYDEAGTWRGGPMYGRLILLRNSGSAEVPSFEVPVELCHEDGTPLEVYGLAGPAVLPASDTSTGFDLIVSDFLDRLWYFRNTGQAGPDGMPRFAPRTPVRTTAEPVPAIDRTPVVPPPPVDYSPVERLPDELVLPTCMHAVTVVRWPNDTTDLLVSAEDGYIRALRLVGRTPEGAPIVEPPERLQEYGARLSVGAKACPNVVDWDGDGRDDLLLGNAAGQILLSRNIGSSDAPVYQRPEPVLAGDRPLWLMAGPPGTMQGPSEVKWGYINPGIGDWPDGQGGAKRAIVTGDSLGNNTLYLDKEGTTDDEGRVRLSRGRRLHVLRHGRWEPLITRWRCRPQLVDWGDGETVYLQVDGEGKLRCYRALPDGPSTEDGEVHVQPLDVLRHADDEAVQLDSDFGGRIGRLKLAVADWDGDGLLDLLMAGSGIQPHGVNTYKKSTVWLLRNIGRPGAPLFERPTVVPLDAGQVALFGGHSCVPAPCFLDGFSTEQKATQKVQLPDLLVGSENGRVYAYRRAYVDATTSVAARTIG